jgi:hypothetical protein
VPLFVDEKPVRGQMYSSSQGSNGRDYRATALSLWRSVHEATAEVETSPSLCCISPVTTGSCRHTVVLPSTRTWYIRGSRGRPIKSSTSPTQRTTDLHVPAWTLSVCVSCCQPDNKRSKSGRAHCYAYQGPSAKSTAGDLSRNAIHRRKPTIEKRKLVASGY